METFSHINLIRNLRTYRNKQNPETDYHVKIVRHPGNLTPNIVECMTSPEDTEHPQEEVSLVDEEFIDKNHELALSLVAAIQDGFEMIELDVDDALPGDFMAEEMFITALEKGLDLVGENPYIELHMLFVRTTDGHVCILTVNRTEFDVTQTQQVNTILIEIRYPLVAEEFEDPQQTGE